ncbi:TetR/AcrR family transcriptional regulator [Haematospirillum jordaniae]|uniref:HTH tetR-type domain-containing protein n=1 Tax=Haematospirillum jordaniae TaxID=1549855 RepID=A0A143DEE4_9PROT|nr:TetR/AcrR family transcriptional regulator [Haematospirillum jordaniae]AMW35026.1 hypothetical protein AY555_07370 [Haematospirillum jordaniae]NKD44237.1 TetR/AcrR family transcriptional regulator [Haematospirillum jordaniae]NKD56615.1 TetR/AcrR family transcriptional regulator [Haematospirillum jordaniae]NKD58673.1 TetR/AcrR family transcriptional regulator [Haematospirillum jordaniae]NKD66158.1 TetR/AcrR family transcriptional regulator [Haematospirillum jordaniae]
MPRRTAVLRTDAARPSLKRDTLVEVAERLFDRYGFHGTGVDRLVQESGVARMTFYKHFPTKNALVRAVLERRDERFRSFLDRHVVERSDPAQPEVLAIFDALADWLDDEGAQGNLLLRAVGEFSGHDVSIAGDAVFRCRWAGPWFAERLGEQGVGQADARGWDLALLLEGAVALAPVVGGRDAAGQAKHAASALLLSWNISAEI